ncbi:MAG: hypothetical protein PHN69_02505 [Candidatus Pacebacteria bacterium]|nr:hypothetical protein [Candidatus Paceibacterota bacterium]
MIKEGLLKNIGECLICKAPIYQDKDGKVYFSCECTKRSEQEKTKRRTEQ